jgi:hypothetical protein
MLNGAWVRGVSRQTIPRQTRASGAWTVAAPVIYSRHAKHGVRVSLRAAKVKFVAKLCVIVLSICAASIAAGDEQAPADAETAALLWLSQIDAGNYAESWTAASTRFRTAIRQQQWQTRAAQARSGFGALKSRKLQSATFKRSLPGVPDGEYVVIRFASSFENKAEAVETVTPMKDEDGSWRVAGYYIE